MAKIFYLNTQIGGIETLPAAVGDGRTLGLNPTQFDTLKKNAASQIVAFSSKEADNSQSISEVSANENISAEPVAQAVSEMPAVENTTPVVDTPVVENVVSPVEPVVPNVASEVVNPQPIVDPQPVVTPVPEVVPVVENSPVQNPVTVDPVIPSVENNIPVVPESPVVEDVPVVDTTAPVIESPVSAPVVDTPVTTTIPEPVIPEVSPTPVPGQVEIVSSTPENTDYDALMNQIEEINVNYDKQIAELNKKRTEEIQKALEDNKEKIAQYESNIKDLQGRAEEHLKNAQAAETIATIAQANAQNIDQIQE